MAKAKATTKLADASAAVMVIKHRGEEYRLSPLTVADLGELERWIETLHIERARRRITAWGDDITPEQRDKIITAAEEAAAKSTALSADFAQSIMSIEGTVYLLYLSLRNAHPEITREMAAAMVKPGELEKWQDRLDKISGMSGDGDADPTPLATKKTESLSTGAESTAP